MSNLFSRLFGTVKHSVDSRSASRRSLRLEALEDRQLLTTVGWEVAPADTAIAPLAAGDTVTFTATITELTEGEEANGPIILNFTGIDSEKLTPTTGEVFEEGFYTLSWSKIDANWNLDDSIDVTFTIDTYATGLIGWESFSCDWDGVDSIITVNPEETAVTLYLAQLDAPVIEDMGITGDDQCGIEWDYLDTTGVADFTVYCNGEEAGTVDVYTDPIDEGIPYFFTLDDCDKATTYTFTVVANPAEGFVASDMSNELAITTSPSTLNWTIDPDTEATPVDPAGENNFVDVALTSFIVTNDDIENGDIVVSVAFDNTKFNAPIGADVVDGVATFTITAPEEGWLAGENTLEDSFRFVALANATGSTSFTVTNVAWADEDLEEDYYPIEWSPAADAAQIVYFNKLNTPVLSRYTVEGADPQTTAGISWTNEMTLPNSKVAGYELLVNGEVTEFETNAGGCYCFLENLAAGATYTFTVKALAEEDTAFVDSDQASINITTNDAVWNLATWQNTYSRFGLSTTVDNSGTTYLNLDGLDGKGGVVNLRTALLNNSDVNIVSSATRSLTTMVRSDVLTGLDATNSDVNYNGNTNLGCRQDNLAFLGTAGNDRFTIYGSNQARDYTYGQGGITLNDTNILDHPDFVFTGVRNAAVNSGAGIDQFEIIDLNTAWTFVGDNTNANTLDFSRASILGPNATGAVVNLNSSANQHMVCGEVGTIRILGNFNNVVGSFGRDVVVGNTGVNSFTDGSDPINVVNFALTSGSTVLVAGDHQVIYGGNGIDNITVAGDFASITTLDGNDVVTVLGDHNVINTGEGEDDVIIAGAYNTAVLGNGYNRACVSDRLVFDTTSASWIVESQSQYNRVIGGNDRDYIVGWDPANKTVRSTGNFNFFYGGNGNDFIHGGNGNDYIYGQGGMDILCGGTGSDFIYGGTGSAFILGNSSATGPENAYATRTLPAIRAAETALATCLTGTDTARDAATRVIFGAIAKDTAVDYLYRAAGTDGTNFLDSGNDIIVDLDLYDVVLV